MAVRTIKVWNAATSEWEGIGIEMPDVPAPVAGSDINPLFLAGV